VKKLIFKDLIMRENNISLVHLRLQPAKMVLGLFVFFISWSVNLLSQEDKKESIAMDNIEIIWHIKAIHPNGYFINIKALDRAGHIYDVKAFQNSVQTSILDIKALVNGKRVPIKILVSDDNYGPVKGIMEDGTLLDIKAITAQGDKLDIKAVGRSGNITDIKAITKNGEFYGVKAISPNGDLNDVKGVKMFNKELEMNLNGIEVHSHVKALTQVGCTGDNFMWHIIAIHPEGIAIDVLAVDKDGNTFPVKAIKNTKQRSVIDVKVYIDGSNQLPVKILVSNEKYAPVKAIGLNGSIYNIKGFTSEGEILDIKGVNRSGSIINIKAIAKNGEFYGVKAISPEGELNDVKGVKMSSDAVEYKINGIEIGAHVKALPQMK